RNYRNSARWNPRSPQLAQNFCKALLALFTKPPALVALNLIDLVFHSLPQPFAACNNLLPIRSLISYFRQTFISYFRQTFLDLHANLPLRIPEHIKLISGVGLPDPIVETSQSTFNPSLPV